MKRENIRCLAKKGLESVERSQRKDTDRYEAAKLKDKMRKKKQKNLKDKKTHLKQKKEKKRMKK